MEIHLLLSPELQKILIDGVIMQSLGVRDFNLVFQRVLFNAVELRNNRGFNLGILISSNSPGDVLSDFEFGFNCEFPGIGVASSVPFCSIDEVGIQYVCFVELGRGVENRVDFTFWGRRLPFFASQSQLAPATVELTIDPSEDIRL